MTYRESSYTYIYLLRRGCAHGDNKIHMQIHIIIFIMCEYPFVKLSLEKWLIVQTMSLGRVSSCNCV